MSFEIIGTMDHNRLYCMGSFTKFLTTYIALTLFSKQTSLPLILDDANFFDSIAVNKKTKQFVQIFQKHVGGKFTVRDICSYYSGLPYTFGLAEEELESVEMGYPFKHHSILEESVLLHRCQKEITPVYPNRSKFHYSELGIIFLGYLIEQVYETTFERLYKEFILEKFSLQQSIFSRTLPPNAFVKDLSDKYDYPSIAILDHGYFCYSNGFYTTPQDMKILLDQLIQEPIFSVMTDLRHARAASHRLMNGLTVEIRCCNDDIIYGYEGLSFSGCNLWAYSTKLQRGYITFHDSEEEVYKIIYDDILGYYEFDVVPEHTQEFYRRFSKNYQDKQQAISIPEKFQGYYHRVRINDANLSDQFVVGENFIIIRNPETVKYDVICVNDCYRIKGKDNIYGAKVGFYTAESGNHYMLYDGTLYKKLINAL